jgi:hypothetical protein
MVDKMGQISGPTQDKWVDFIQDYSPRWALKLSLSKWWGGGLVMMGLDGVDRVGRLYSRLQAPVSGEVRFIKVMRWWFSNDGLIWGRQAVSRLRCLEGNSWKHKGRWQLLKETPIWDSQIWSDYEEVGNHNHVGEECVAFSGKIWI